jgi:hypothetical protein
MKSMPQILKHLGGLSQILTIDFIGLFNILFNFGVVNMLIRWLRGLHLYRVRA